MPEAARPPQVDRLRNKAWRTVASQGGKLQVWKPRPGTRPGCEGRLRGLRDLRRLTRQGGWGAHGQGLCASNVGAPLRCPRVGIKGSKRGLAHADLPAGDTPHDAVPSCPKGEYPSRFSTLTGSTDGGTLPAGYLHCAKPWRAQRGGNVGAAHESPLTTCTAL